MGRYTTQIIDEKTFRNIVTTIKDGYQEPDGTVRRPNPQIAMILLLQANLGCRIGDIVALKTDSIVKNDKVWQLDIIEQKTDKKRNFIVPEPVKQLVDDYIKHNNIQEGRLFDIEPPAVWKALRQVTAYLNLENISAHSFRKFAGLRIYLNSGKDIALTTQFYQHSDPSTTSRYLKRTSKQMDEAITKSVCLL